MGILITLAILIIIVIFIVLYVINTYNTFISLGERVTNGKAQIAAQIESRFDAVKNLIQATKQYAEYESETLENVVSQRVGVNQNSSIEQIEKENNELEQVVGRLIAISEAYPELKASDVYKTTMESVNKYEDNVRHARMIYNDVVTKFNRMIKMFPSNIIASLFKFEAREYFEETSSKQDMPSWD